MLRRLPGRTDMSTTNAPTAQIARKLAGIPDQVIFDEAKRRYNERRETLGKYASMKVFRTCKGCGGNYSARQMRNHECSVPYSQR